MRPPVDEAAKGAEPFEVLFVCTANHCRSPLAEHLLRQRVQSAGLGWTVDSAGTRCRPGVPLHPLVARLLGERGIDSEGWGSRLLTPGLVARADLVLTAAEEHRGVVATLVPRAMSRTFTLLQLAHLLRHSPTAPGPLERASGPALLRRAALAQGQVQPMPKAERDLADPMGQPWSRFEDCAATVTAALDQLLPPGSAGAFGAGRNAISG